VVSSSLPFFFLFFSLFFPFPISLCTYINERAETLPLTFLIFPFLPFWIFCLLNKMKEVESKAPCTAPLLLFFFFLYPTSSSFSLFFGGDGEALADQQRSGSLPFPFFSCLFLSVPFFPSAPGSRKRESIESEDAKKEEEVSLFFFSFSPPAPRPYIKETDSFSTPFFYLSSLTPPSQSGS